MSYTPSVQRHQWTVFALLNASWITFGLATWLTFMGLERLLQGWGVKGPGYEWPMLLVMSVLALAVGLALPSLLLTSHLRRLRPDLPQGLWAFIAPVYAMFSGIYSLGERFLPVGLQLAPTVLLLLLALAAGSLVSWLFSFPPRPTEQTLNPQPHRLAVWWRSVPTWLRWVGVVLAVLSVDPLLSMVEVALAHLTVGRQEIVSVRGWQLVPERRIEYARPSPDGRWIAVTLTKPRPQVILVDARTKARLWQVDLDFEYSEPIWLQEEPRLLVAGRYRGERNVLLNAVTGQQVEQVGLGFQFCQKRKCAFSSSTTLPDGRWVNVRGRYESKGAWLEDAAGQRVGPSFVRGSGDEVATSVALSVNGRRVAVGYADGTVIVFEPLTGRALTQWRPHTERVMEMSWSASGERLATYGAGNCGSLGSDYCVMVTRFPTAKPVSVALWRSDKFDASPSLGWLSDTRLLLDDSYSAAFTVNAPER